MPSYSDRESIDSGRQSVPMWDSSDPDRAPPPLPIPPGSPGLATRSNASANIQATAQRLTERARENMPASAYTTNPVPATSPDKSLIKGAHHRRLQSLQTGSVSDLRTYIDGMRNTSPERPTSRSTATPQTSPNRGARGDYFSSPPQDHTPTPADRNALRDAPNLRPASRPRAILGENTPPSATMLALQTMAARDPDSSHHDATNSSSSREPKTLNEMMAQLTNITNITSGMQKEMAQLNRRSKDNAADLIGLKQAADSRDEEIRRNLRDLLSNVSASEAGSVFGGRSSAFGLGLLENKGLTSPTAGARPFGSLPRSNSHGSFLDPGSPNPFSMDGAASVAMLEKIIREMVTKDGQDRLLSTLSELLEKHSRDNVQAHETAQKVADLSEFIKEKSGSHALVRHDSDAQDDEQKSKAIDAMSADILRLLHKIKDSTSQSGGLSNEIKALLQNLRGEVLGMGRELGRQLDQANSTNRVAEDGSQIKTDVEEIVNQGLSQLKEHMEHIIQQNSQQLIMSNHQDETKNKDMYDIVKSAITEHSSALVQAQPQSEGLDRASILEAVKDAIEEFRPEIELQQFGLERDEILSVLKEGLHDYQSNKEPSAAPGANIEEVESAMQRALQEFNPPRPVDEMASFKEDLLASIRQSIEELKSAGPDDAATHAIVLGAVKEGLENHGPHAPREFEISKDDLFDAVKASLDGSTLPFGSFGEQVLNQLRDLIEEMKGEFKQYSAANGHDTEQVLDALKDGLESLRHEVESYVDRAQDVTGKDEIVDVVRNGLEQLRGDVQGYCAEGPANGRNEMIDYIKAEFEHLHEAVSGLNSREGEEGRPSSTSEILVALEAGFLELKNQTSSRGLLDETNEEVLEAMKAEFEALRDAVIAGSNTHKAEVIESIQESLDALHDKVGTREDGSSDNDLLLSMKDELAHLRETLAATLLKSGAAAERDEMVETIREAVDTIRMQISSEQGEANAETLAALKEQLENFRESTTKGLVLSNGDNDEEPPHAPLDEIRTRLDEIAAANSGSSVNTALLEAIQGEFQQIRHSLGSSGSRADTEEVLDAVRLGLDDLQSSLEKKIDNPEVHRNLNNELMDVLNEGLDNMRSDVSKIMDKPVDMTVNYEILETLKEGVASLRADMEKLTGGDRPSTALGSELILADAPGEEGSRELGEDDKAAPVSLKDRMEALFAQLHIKVEGLAASIGDMPSASSVPAEGTALKEDLFGMEETLRHIQDTLAVMAEKEQAEVDNAVTKEDTDAIETLLRNTKAQLEELPATTASREQLDDVEAAVRSAKEVIDGLATKEDVAVVEVLLKDLATAFEDSKSKASEEDEEESASHLDKADLDALGMLCTEIKEKISELNLPDPEALPSKADVEQITGLINDFRESHDKVREGYENDIAITAKAFDDRRKEAEEMAEAISGVKTFLEEVKAEILAKVEEGTPGMTNIEEAIKSIDDKVAGDEGIAADIKELLETVKNEFERSHESLGGIKIDHEQNSSTLLEKHAEHKDAIVAAVTEKVDSCFDGLMSKYDDAQAAAHEKAKSMEDQVEQQKEMLTSTKEMTDELKLSIDTLGTSLTAFIPSFNEATEKISEDSKTVFEKVEGAMLKMDEHNDGLKTEHQTTRDEVVKVAEAITLLQGDFSEYNPQFSMSLKELHALISAHYEHSQQLATTAEEQAKTVHETIRAATEESKTHVETLFADNLKNHLSENLSAQTEELKGALPALLPAPVEPVEKYDDTAVHEKLDKLVSDTGVHEKLDTLVNLAGEAGAATAQMERLDEIHAQVKATAAEVSAFVAIQQKQITEGQESKELEAQEVALLLERRQVQKDNIESEISSLNEEKESLQAVVEALRAEKDALAAQKARLNGDVASLHTALEIRREELHNMDEKADALERRILEGLIDHSRAMLLTQKTPKTSPKKKPMRDLRLPSDASTTHLPAPTTPSLLQSHALAMKTRGMPKKTGTTPNTGERRIMSLSQISGNLPTGGAATYSAAAPSLVSAQGSINRSQSLKHNKLRKISWGTARAAADKENDIEEVTEIESNYGGSRPVSRDSEYRPQSRDYDSRPVSRDSLDSSYYNSSRRSVSYAGSQSAWTESNSGMTDDGRRTSLGTLGTYDTGSYMTGSDLDRRTSFGSTIRSTMDHIHEEDDDSDFESERHVEPETPAMPVEAEAAVAGKDVVPYAPPSDSGIGSDLPTAALQGNGDYFAGAMIPATVNEDQAA
ncbi:hypothetical protein D6D22_00654 [Aureobasidium pullulans]|uniref:Chromosome segregation ATPase family protein n=1 Tax=Aureobasidium pullulans TaxID=5580 RepID=A0A4S8YLD4_AURPU|nr:hypothetical protein D6D22_00654 [Aureobasidium pullulans]